MGNFTCKDLDNCLTNKFKMVKILTSHEFPLSERRKEEDYDEEVEEDLQDEVSTVCQDTETLKNCKL